jgi:hypothetical protein
VGPVARQQRIFEKILGGRVDPFLIDPWSQSGYMKILGGEVEPLGNELVEDQETVLSPSKTFLQCTLHCTAAPDDGGTKKIIGAKIT